MGVETQYHFALCIVCFNRLAISYPVGYSFIPISNDQSIHPSIHQVFPSAANKMKGSRESWDKKTMKQQLTGVEAEEEG